MDVGSGQHLGTGVPHEHPPPWQYSLCAEARCRAETQEEPERQGRELRMGAGGSRVGRGRIQGLVMTQRAEVQENRLSTPS